MQKQPVASAVISFYLDYSNVWKKLRRWMHLAATWSKNPRTWSHQESKVLVHDMFFGRWQSWKVHIPRHSGLTTSTSFHLVWMCTTRRNSKQQSQQLSLFVSATGMNSQDWSTQENSAIPEDTRTHQLCRWKLRYKNARSLLTHHMKQQNRPQMECNKSCWVTLPFWLDGCVKHN